MYIRFCHDGPKESEKAGVCRQDYPERWSERVGDLSHSDDFVLANPGLAWLAPFSFFDIVERFALLRIVDGYSGT